MTRPGFLTLATTREALHAGDDPGSPVTSEVPANTTLATLLAMGAPYVPEVAGFTWVASQPQDRPGVDRSGLPMAVLKAGRIRFLQRPAATLQELGVTHIHYESAYHHDLDEAVAVLEAGGRAGPLASAHPPLHGLRQHVEWGLAGMAADYRVPDKVRRSAETLARRLHRSDPDMAELLDFASSDASPSLVATIRLWASYYANPLVPLADHCSRTLYDFGYYDRQRALEAWVTKHLPPPSAGWPDLPVYLGTDLATLRNVDVGGNERRFFRNLAAIDQLIAA